jgi:hypothetical protein
MAKFFPTAAVVYFFRMPILAACGRSRTRERAEPVTTFVMLAVVIDRDAKTSRFSEHIGLAVGADRPKE